MRYVDEYRDSAATRRLAAAIRRTVTRSWTLMEICGGQTHSIVKYGLDALLPPGVTLVHGPGCPVCVTSVGLIDAAIKLAAKPGVTLCSFGDMLRVPGSDLDLQAARSRGADVRIVYSPFDAVNLARREPGRNIAFFAVGFETTAPATALAVLQARQLGLRNFSLLVAHVLVPPAIEALLSAPDNVIRGFLAAGHVCTVTGLSAYQPIAAQFRVPIVATGFEPVDILRGVLACVTQLEQGRAEIENAYGRAVRLQGNLAARQAMERVFVPADREWRGLGLISCSGLELRAEFAEFDARSRFSLRLTPATAIATCIAGRVLRGQCRPTECPAFGTKCTPDHPLGAPMVSSEGACAAYHRYRRLTAR
ncbi:MAG TPA: hydrogenase formation protein HypD [Opitutaceae bacterium]|nr:hydrogenase formation protein HypD [Opitutaceae bacterium]